MTSLLAPYTSIARRSVNEDHYIAVPGKYVTATTQKATPNIVVTENPPTVARASATINYSPHISPARSATTRTTTTTANSALTPLPTSILKETRSSISKIPSPLGALLNANKRGRSASVRMRGTKSNLQHETRSENNAGSCGGTISTINKMDMEQEANSTHTAGGSGGVDCEVGVNGGNGINAHDISNAGGQISARRKVVLTSQKVLSPAVLTRSLCLRRYQTKLKDNNKTDNDKETASCSAVTAAPRTKEQSGNPTTPRQEDSTSLGKLDTDAVDHHRSYNFSEVHTDMTGQKDMADALQGGSLKLLNSATAKTTTTTPATRPTTLATTTAAAAAVAPNENTEATNPESGTAITPPSITVKAQKPPRASTTTAPQIQPSSQAQRHPQPHSQVQSLSIHRGCNRRSPSDRHTPLYSVPEATTTAKLTPCTPPVTPDSPSTFLDDDLDSMYSFATTTSGRSTMSCDHPYVARNGTTFSGRKMKYVVHCSNYAGQVGPDYLTPTQRAARQVRRLKELLCAARQDLEQKDSELLRLTREVVELRLFKASLSSPEERSASSDAVTVREAELKTSQDVSPIVDMADDGSKSSPRHIIGVTNHNHNHHHNHSQHHPHQYQSQQQHSSEMQSSFADSGHFEDLTSSSVNSKDDSYSAHTHDIACGSDVAVGGDAAASYELQRQELIRVYEERIEELIRNQDANATEVKRSHNDKVEALLQKLAECNTRYADIVPDYELAKERIRELEKHLEELQRKLAENEDKQNKMYLHMYQQGQEAERIARADQALELAHRAPNNKVSLNELLHQLQSTQDELENIRAAECRNECGSNHALLTAKEAISLWVLGARKTIYRRLLEAQKNRTHVDPEITLQFLKSAVYYFLTDKENSQGHLQAIESILEFTEAEKQNINRGLSAKKF